jgi:hypothetical protein
VIYSLPFICISNTSNEDYVSLKQRYYNRLLKRGYTPVDLITTFSIPLDRSDLRNKRDAKLKKLNVSKITPLIAVFYNTPRITEMNIAQCFRYTDDVHLDKDFHKFIPNQQPMISRKGTTSLKNLIVSSKLANP